MSENTILILGARSEIAMAVAHRFAKAGYDIQLAARNANNLTIDKSDLELRYCVSVSLHEFDALEIQSYATFIESLPQLPTVAVCAVGFMGKQPDSEVNVEASLLVLRSNFEGPAGILAALANKFEQRGFGCLVGISSVAGERGRATNYVYGSAKAGFSAFLSGLRSRLVEKGVHVVTVLPGFVSTKMTADMDLPTILTANVEDLGNEIYKAVVRSDDVVYSGRLWYFIMILIRNIPEAIFKRLKI